MEHSPTPQEPEHEYGYPDHRTEALHLICAHGWSEKTDGSPDSPVGLFSHITNNTADIFAIQDAFGDLLEELGVTVADVSGHFIVTVKDGEPVHYAEFATRDAAHLAYTKLQGAFYRWQAGLPPEE